MMKKLQESSKFPKKFKKNPDFVSDLKRGQEIDTNYLTFFSHLEPDLIYGETDLTDVSSDKSKKFFQTGLQKLIKESIVILMLPFIQSNLYFSKI